MEKPQVTLNGNPLQLSGPLPEVGRLAPDFTALDTDLKDVRLADFRGHVVVLAAVPSLDTEVCDLETRRFNQEATDLGDKVVVLAVSMDLPFAQKRWCAAAGVDRVKTLSDHRLASFGKAYGLLIEELRLLARAVLVVDAEGVLRYLQLVPKVEQEPDYQAVLEAVKQLPH